MILTLLKLMEKFLPMLRPLGYEYMAKRNHKINLNQNFKLNFNNKSFNFNKFFINKNILGKTKNLFFKKLP